MCCDVVIPAIGGQSAPDTTGHRMTRAHKMFGLKNFTPGILLSGLLVAGIGPMASDAVATQKNSWSAVPFGPFHWQLQGDIADDVTGSKIIGADLYEVTAAQIRDWREAGLFPVCYINVGALEDWRDDYSDFPKHVIGNAYWGWDGEYWLDIARFEHFADVMTARFDLCRDKGFLGVEPDNIDGYEADLSNKTTGFDLKRTDQLRYIRWLIDLAHQRGLAIGQKNAPELVGDLVDQMDFAILESAFRLDFMDAFDPYIAHGKPVFAVEYREEGANAARFCPVARNHGFQGVIASLELDQTPQNCP
tara:strand:- start:1146 stop:2060 length:915 start_codon:yes stop_codon:yes gene_type:complete